MATYEENYVSIEDVNNKLEEQGYAVVSSVVDGDIIENCKTNMWESLTKISSNWETPITFENKDSYKGIYKLLPLHSMLIQHFGLGHSQFAWDIRSNENVADVFAKIWNCKKSDLIVSMDGVSIHMPPEVTKRGWFRNEWFHTDQRFTVNEKYCIQGLVNLYDVNEGDASTKILKGSHKYHNEFYKKFKDDIEYPNKDWFKLNNEKHVKFFTDKGCEKIMVKAKAGDLVLWDSRTFHCGSEPIKNRKKMNYRGVVYICMSNRNRANKKNLEKRLKIFNKKRLTTHSPFSALMFPKNPRTYGAELPILTKLDEPILSDFAKSLL